MLAAPKFTPAAVGVLALGAVLAIYLTRNSARAIGSSAVGAVVDAGVGVVQGIGQAVGIPATSKTQCDADIAAGRTWDASFSCPASRWLLEGVFGSSETTESAPATWGREVRAPVFTGGASGSW